jgi:hypothetical protein
MIHTERFAPISVRWRDSAPAVDVVDLGPGDLAAEIIRQARAGVHRPECERLWELMHATIPYGFWQEIDGGRVVFNRRYQPLWRVRRDGSRERAERATLRDYVQTTYHFFDANPPWADAAMRRRARAVLMRDGDLDGYLSLVADVQSKVHAVHMERAAMT